MNKKRLATILSLIAALAVLLASGCAATNAAGSSSEAKAESSTHANGQGRASSSAQTAPEQTKLVACIGDSITHGLREDGTDDSWSAMLNERLASQGWEFVNLGVNGRSLQDNARISYRATGNLEQARNLNPDMAIIMLGTNDAFQLPWDEQNFRAALEALVDEVRAFPSKPQVVLMAPPRVFTLPEKAEVYEEADRLLAGPIRSITRETANKRNLQFVDLYALTEGHPEWFADYVHPNADGNKAMADCLAEQLFTSS